MTELFFSIACGRHMTSLLVPGEREAVSGREAR